jgi:hypothetical protein
LAGWAAIARVWARTSFHGDVVRPHVRALHPEVQRVLGIIGQDAVLECLHRDAAVLPVLAHRPLERHGDRQAEVVQPTAREDPAVHIRPEVIGDQVAGLEVTNQPAGTTILEGPLADQGALFGVLLRIRDLNVRLLSLQLVAGDGRYVEHKGTLPAEEARG